jgi:WD40 repeat protein
MKKCRILLIMVLITILIASSACSLTPLKTPTPTGIKSSPSTLIPASSPTPTSPPATPLPVPTATLKPTTAPLPTLTLTLVATRTRVPFLPENLAVISPQNASRLEKAAVLPEKGASVVAFSPDSRWMATGFFSTNQVKIWDLTSGEEKLSLNGHAAPRIISYLAFSPDGTQLADGAQGWEAANDSLILWDAVTGSELQRFNGRLGAISPDWHLAALTQREQGQETTLDLVDLASGELKRSLKAAGDIYDVAFSAQGKQVAAKMYSVFQDLFSFWSVDSGKMDRTLYGWRGFSYSSDGRLMAVLMDIGSGTDQGELNLIDAATFAWVKTLARDADTLWFAYPAFSPDGRILAASCGSRVILWDTQTWAELASLPTTGPTGLAFSPDGHILTTFTQSGEVQLWGVTEGQ